MLVAPDGKLCQNPEGLGIPFEPFTHFAFQQ